MSELEERSGLDFGKLKDFDVLAAQPVPKSLVERCPTASTLDGGPGGRAVGSLTSSLIIYSLVSRSFLTQHLLRHEAFLL